MFSMVHQTIFIQGRRPQKTDKCGRIVRQTDLNLTSSETSGDLCKSVDIWAAVPSSSDLLDKNLPSSYPFLYHQLFQL